MLSVPIIIRNMAIIMLVIMIQYHVPLSVEKIVHTRNRIESALGESVRTPRCSTLAPQRGLGSWSAKRTSQFSNCNPCLLLCIVMLFSGNILDLFFISRELDRQGLQVVSHQSL